MFEISRIQFAIVLLMTWSLFRIVVLLNTRKKNITREIVMTVFFIYLFCVIQVTFFDFRVYLFNWHFAGNFIPFIKTISMIKGAALNISLVNVLGNLILLAPLGLFLPLLFERFRKFNQVIFYSFIVSLVIELLQYFLMVRLFDVDDLILNTLGSAIGYLCFCVLTKSKILQVVISRLRTNQSKPFAVIVVPSLVLILLFSAFWFPAYWGATYPLDQNAKNSIYQFVHGEVIKQSMTDYSLFILSKDKDVINSAYFIRTPFDRAIQNGSGQLGKKNSFGNTYSFSGNSTSDQKMYYIFYGFNTTATYLVCVSAGAEYKVELSKGYFVSEIRIAMIGNIEIRFYDSSNQDITNEFE